MSGFFTLVAVGRRHRRMNGICGGLLYPAIKFTRRITRFSTSLYDLNDLACGYLRIASNNMEPAGVTDKLMGSLSDRFELPRHGGRKHVLSMEGLRGFAVFLVFLVHYASLIVPWLAAGSATTNIAEDLHTIGNAGVDLFFVLSGFLIYGSLIRRQVAFLPYMRQRIRRIYPAFCVVFALYLLLSFALPAQSKIPAGAWHGAIYLLQNFLLLPGLFPIEALITVAWSLSYEMFYYIVLPPIILAFGLHHRTARWRVMFFLAVGSAIVLTCAVAGGPIRLVMFIAGILLFEALGSSRLAAPRSATAALLLVAGLSTTLIKFPGVTQEFIHPLLLAGTFFMLCFCCFQHPERAMARAFAWTPIRWLGNMSYSYYLLHGLALKAGFILLAKLVPATTNDALLFVGVLVPMFMLTLVPTTLLYLFVERPFSLNSAKPVPIPAPAAVGSEKALP